MSYLIKKITFLVLNIVYVKLFAIQISVWLLTETPYASV